MMAVDSRTAVAPGIGRPERHAARQGCSALPDRKTLDGEIARLRDLDVGELRSRWYNVFGRRPHPHLPRHLLFRVLAYRLQAGVHFRTHAAQRNDVAVARLFDHLVGAGKHRIGNGDAEPSTPTIGMGSSAPPEFAAFVMAEQAKWGPVVRATGAKLE